MLLQCREFPGIRIGLGRKEITKLKQTTVITLLREAHPMLGINSRQFFYQDQKGLITYLNGSSIQLVDLAKQPSDPEYDSFGSLNFTHTVVEEGGEVVKKARDVFISRKNRFMNGEYNLVGRSITTCNPSQNYLKSEYYRPYMEKGGGDYQKWEHGRVEIEGKMQTAYRAFIRSLASDNPFIPQNYIEVLRKLPDPERKRLLEGNWDFEDTDKMLFKPVSMDRALIDEAKMGERYIGADVADTGSDKTIFSLYEADILIEQRKIEVDKNKAIGEQIALELIKYAQQNGIDQSKASHIGLDVLGVGASTRDFMRQRGWYVREFVAGGKGADGFRNLRGEVIYKFSQDIEKLVVRFYNRCPMLELLRDDLYAHEYTTEERMIVVKSKKDIKEVLGRSPDNAESAYIGYWASHGEMDPKRDKSRIIY